MLYKCTEPDCEKKFGADVSFGEPEVCPFCGVESVEKHNLFGRGVADNH